MQQAFIFKQMTFSVLDADLILILIFSQDDAVEVAADKVTQHDAYIDAEDLKGVGLEEGYRHCAIVESVCHAVGEAAYYEERNRKQERKHVAFAGECHRCGHEEAAWDAEEATSEGPGIESELKDFLRSSLDIHRRNPCHESEAETADDVTEKYQEKLSYFILIDESSCTSVELKLVSDHGHESEGEEHCSNQ